MNIRSIRKKIKSVKNVKKITKAMQMISAVKMKKAVTLESDGRSYRDGLTEMMARISDKVDATLSPLFAEKAPTVEKDLVILISANKGLCGSFFVNIFKPLLKNVNLKETDFVTVGSKGAQMLSRIDRDIVADFSSAFPLTQVTAIFDFVLKAFLTDQYKRIRLVYTKYISTLKSEVVIEDLLPISKSFEQQRLGANTGRDILIEPNPKTLINSLLMSFVEEKIRGALISSLAVEHSLRMMAMKNATDNAEDVIYSLTLTGNKVRQAKITGELLDMITAKESVEA